MTAIIETVKKMQAYSSSRIAEGKIIGFVPTMGFLHEGHLSLIREAKKHADIVVVSIFVNPTQFAQNEDLDKYPRNFEKDFSLLEKENVDVLFFPEKEEIYGDNFQTYVNVESISQKLEGESRPSHFRGVTTIVSILFNAVKPNVVVFGQKDAQQAAIIKRMVNDLKFDIKIIIAPIIREADGLAMSSRNVYLSDKERKESLILNETILSLKELALSGEYKTENLISAGVRKISNVDSAELDYIKIVDSKSFEIVSNLKKGNEYFILIACKVGSTRLIDNILFKL